MKSKFATIDLCAVIHDLLELKSMRVVNVYDINSKTFLIKLQKPNDKAFILFESGIRIHKTAYEWPKSMFPSSFSMKFRKHINQKRLINVTQVSMDRIVDLQFGEDERTCHVIVELYDRGNIVLTDHEYMILNILRPRTDADSDVRFSVKEKYPIENARKEAFLPSLDNIQLFLENGKDGELLKRALVRHIPFGSSLLDHCLMTVGFPANTQVCIHSRALIGVHIPKNRAGAECILRALKLAEEIADRIKRESCRGFIAYKQTTLQNGNVVDAYQEFYPFDFCQFRADDSALSVAEFPHFSDAVDKFYSSIESQKAEQKVVHVERETSRRLDNIRRDHEQRLRALEEVQGLQERRGEYVQYNRELVDRALLLIRTALASKSNWKQIADWIEQCVKAGVDAARAIVKLDLASNVIVMRLTNPYARCRTNDQDDEKSSEEEGEDKADAEPLNVDIDIGLTADQNVRKYFGNRRTALEKQQKTLAASNKALKSALVQTKTKINQASVKTNIIRARKTYWFEKFLWFISSDGFLVIAGRDAQQNELLVKRYFRPGDIYVHAEIQGAASVIVRNRVAGAAAETPPPRTLNEAGTMAICFSSAWDAKVVISAWWVRHDQVSRTAPTGEYLSTGSFMIRGKKNFLPPSQLQLGFGLMFKLDDESAAQRRTSAKDKASIDGGGEAEDASAFVNSEKFVEESELLDSDNEATEKDGDDVVNDNDGKDEEFPDVKVDLHALRVEEPLADGTAADEYSIITLAPSTANTRNASKKTETEKYLESRAARTNKKQSQKQRGKKTASSGQLADGDEDTKASDQPVNRPMNKRQKHKLEIIRKKYKDQDDEEREIRMAILGSAGKKNDSQPAAPPKRAPAAKEESKAELDTAEDKDVANDGAKDAEANNENEKSERPEADEVEEAENDPEEKGEEDPQIIDSFTSTPLHDDTLLFILGLCGPYSIMQKYKYKVKITPGTGKRGKAVKMAYSLFLRDKTITEAERLLIKNLIGDDHVPQCLPSKVRVMAPMLQNTKGK